MFRFAYLFFLFYSLASTSPSHGSVPTSVLAPAEALDCVHQYWLSRLNTNVIVAQANTKIARAQWYPSLLGNATAQKELLIDPKISQTTGNFVLSETIFDLARGYTIDQRHAEEKSSQDDLEDQVLTILQSTVTSYFSTATAATQVEIYKKRIERLQKFLDVVQELARLRISDKASVYNLDVELTQTQSDLLQLEATLKNSLSQLLGFMGEGELRDIQLQTKYNLPKEIKIDPTKVTTQLPVVQNLHLQNQALMLNAKAAHAGYVPTFAVQTTYTPSKLNYSSAAAVSPDGLTTIGGYNPSSFIVEGLLTWNIFDQGVKSIQAGQYEAQADTAERLSQAKTSQNEVTIAGLLKQYDLSMQSSALTNERSRQATQAFESAMTLFRLGKISYLLVKDSENSLFASELEQRRLDLQSAAINYQLSLYRAYDQGRYQRLSTKSISCKSDY